MVYQHQNIEGAPLPLPTGKVVGVGGNFLIADQKPAEPPWLFIKPATALCSIADAIAVSQHRQPVHAELEVAVLIGQALSQAAVTQVPAAIAGYGLALDLVLPALHARLRAQGEPWERAKSFDCSCPISTWHTDVEASNPALEFELWLNQNRVQHGSTATMVLQPYDLVAWISQHFMLMPGDVVVFGNPNPSTVLTPHDEVEARIESMLTVQTTVV